MLNLEWLRTFKVIYEEGSMTAAAEKLFISQPGVSLHLSSLEEHVGYKLFERCARTLLPTERGKILYNAIIDPLGKIEDVEKRILQTSSRDVPTITLGMCVETFQEILEKYLPTLEFDLILEFGDYPNLLAKLGKGLIDLVITPHKEAVKGVVFTPVSQEHIILAAGRDQDCSLFPELGREGRTAELLAWITGQRWYGMAGDNEHLTRFWKSNFNTRPDFRPNYIVPNIHSVIRCLANGSGLAVIPDFLCRTQREQGLIRLLWPGYTSLTNRLYLARRLHPLHAEQIELIENILRKEFPELESE